MAEENITSPRKGGLSVYGTNVLMNITNSIGALPTKNSQVTSYGENAEKISGEWVNANLLVKPHLPRLPGGLQEGSGSQRRPVQGPAHGIGGIRTRLVRRRKLRQ
jgi:hypothetical protein